VKKLRQKLAFFFLILSVALLVWFKLAQPRILVLQSYATDYSWARDEEIGLKRVLGDKSHYKIQWHYMDTKNHPDENFKQRAGKLALHEIKTFRPDLIIAIDDDAQQYAAKYYANDPNTNILFAGIDDSVEQYGYNQASNVTGIYERKPFDSLREALVQMRARDGRPLGKRLVFLGDHSSANSGDLEKITALDWSPFTLAYTKQVDTLAEWKSAITEASSKADWIIVMNYRNLLQDAQGVEFVPHAEVMKWTEAASKIPLVGIGGYMVEDGGMLAIGSSGFEQGDVAGRMAVDILDNGALPKNIPQVMPRQYLVYMRASEMQKRRLVLPDIYEAFSRASNNYY
jgi:ABC-type uncharacterized transport system substrate-binding protein